MTTQTDQDLVISPVNFKKVLVAIDEDDSVSSHKAFNYAVLQAKSLNMQLGIVSVLEVSDINVFDSMSPEVLQQKRQALKNLVADYVRRAESFGVKDIQSFAEEGKPANVILSTVIPHFKPDLLVCGSKSKRKKITEKSRIFLGSQASYLSQNAPCSVMVVR